MDETRASLLIRIQDEGDLQSWQEFYRLYAPLIYRFVRQKGMSQADAEEIRDECMETVVRKISEFQYDRARGGFKNWLRRIAYNRMIDLRRRRREKHANTKELHAVVTEDPGPDEIWDRQWRKAHLRFCVQQIKNEVSEQNYRAFWLLMFEERSVVEVGAELSMNTNQIYKAKSRVLARIRQKLEELGIDA